MTSEPGIEADVRLAHAALPPVFWAILAVAAGLRIAAFNPYGAHHPDEIIQYLEQAHRLVFGYGVVPWEYRYSIRSWLIPLGLSLPMRLGEWLEPGGTLYLVLPRAAFAVANSMTVVAAWKIGERLSRQHAIVAMAVAATWVECVLFQVQTLSESLGIACFLGGAVLLRRGARGSRVARAGLLFALAGLLRFQFAPAIGVYALVVVGKDWRAWRWLVTGAMPVLIGGAAIDLAMGIVPYRWILTNYQMNIGQNRMRDIGGVSATTYITDILGYWGVAAPLLIALALASGKALRPLLIAALVNFAVHQLIPHKEYRYIWFSLQIVLILAAIGSVNLARQGIAARGWGDPQGHRATALIVIGWAAVSAALASTQVYRAQWRVEGDDARLAALAARDRRVCGIGIPGYAYGHFAYALVHRDVPLYFLRRTELPSLSDPREVAPAVNAIVSDRGLAPPNGYGHRVCRAGSCLYVRAGGCTPSAAAAARGYQAMLNRIDM